MKNSITASKMLRSHHIIVIFFKIFSLYETEAKEFKIVNGTNAGLSEFPFMVSLQNNSRHVCGGTILNKKYILTAAHCVCDYNVSKLSEADIFEAFFAYSLSKVGDTRISIKTAICHSYSLLEHINDIAVLELDLPIPKTVYHPVELAPLDFDTQENRNGTLIGWGYNETNGFISTTLQKVDVIIYNDSLCRSSYFSIYNMDLNMCAGWPEDGKGSCQGDSGGPLLFGSIQVGIISRGAKGNCGISNPRQPKILTRLSKYMEWIYNNTYFIIAEQDELNAGNSSLLIGSIFELDYAIRYPIIFLSLFYWWMYW